MVSRTVGIREYRWRPLIAPLIRLGPIGPLHQPNCPSLTLIHNWNGR